jgi:hypothetical protein
MKNRGKGEHTDIWAKNDQAAIERAAAEAAQLEESKEGSGQSH